jgi:hypothetical protein
MIILALALIFLFYTQRDMLSSTLALLGGSAAIMPVILRSLTTSFGGKGAESSNSE